MKQGWIIVLIVLFILLLGGGAFLLLRYQRKINDREADLALLNDDIDKTAEQAEKFQQIAAKVRSGQLSAEEAERQIEAIKNGEDSDASGATETSKDTSNQVKAKKEKAALSPNLKHHNTAALSASGDTDSASLLLRQVKI